MRRLTAFALALLIALAVPLQRASAERRQPPSGTAAGGMAGGGMASDRTADATLVRPDATIAVKILFVPQIPSVGPATGYTALAFGTRTRPGLSRQFRSFPLLI